MSAAVTRLTLDDARRVASGALEAARANGLAISVAIVDDSGRDVFLARSDEAMWVTTDIARRKAVTAAAFRRPSEGLASRSGDAWFGALIGEGMWPGGGGAPLLVAGRLVGAIGISGGSEADDTAIAATAAQLVERAVEATTKDDDDA